MNFLEKYKINNKFENFYKVYDENGNYLYDIDVKDEKKLTNQYLKGVTCFVVNEKGEILLEKRANTELTPGKIDLVSGHMDKNEVGKQAIIRELWEEVGIAENDAINVKKIDTKPLKFESKGKTRNFIIEFYYLLTKNSNLRMQTEEVTSLRWVPMNEVFEMIKLGKTKFPRQSEEVDYNSIFKIVEDAYLNKEKNVITQEERNIE